MIMRNSVRALIAAWIAKALVNSAIAPIGFAYAEHFMPVDRHTLSQHETALLIF